MAFKRKDDSSDSDQYNKYWEQEIEEEDCYLRDDHLQDIGLTANHDYIDSKLQLRVVYRVSDTADIVFALFFLNTRHSIREALIQHCLQQE